MSYDPGTFKYGLKLARNQQTTDWLNDWNVDKYPPSFVVSHYTTLASWAKPIAGRDLAYQVTGFIGIKEQDKKDVFAIRSEFLKDAVFDWSRELLDQYGIDPEVNLSEAQKATGEGDIVQGMILSVPPNKAYQGKFKPIGEQVDPYADTSFTNSIRSTFTCGTKSTTGARVDIQLGGIVKFPSFALAASAASSYTEDTKKTTSLFYESAWFLEDFRGSLIVTLEPTITLKCSVLQGLKDYPELETRSNVKYYNEPATDKAYVITTAVMGEKNIFDYYYGITDQPGYSLNSPSESNIKPLVLTQGMIPYRVDQTEDGSAYMNIIKSLKYFSSSEAGSILPVIAEGNSYVGSDAGSQSRVEIKKIMEKTTETSQSWSGSMTVGAENIISVKQTVNGEFSVSLQNKYETAVGWIVKYLKQLTEQGVFKVRPQVYWIPVGKLKAKYGTREPSGLGEGYSLKFIPDYMWNNDMDYWLLAYGDMKVTTD